jgi:hypothetical protein
MTAVSAGTSRDGSGAVPVTDPSLAAGPAARPGLMRTAGVCWVASAICIHVMVCTEPAD